MTTAKGVSLATRPNNALRPEHTVYVGATGSGKSTAIRKLGRVPHRGQVLFFDPYGEWDKIGRHKVHRFSSWTAFLMAARKGRVSGKPFYLSIKKPANQANVQRFARIAWALADGHAKYQLHLVFEELAAALNEAGAAQGAFGEVMTGGRKFGLVAHTSFQRTQQVPKTILSESPWAWVGKFEDKMSAKAIENRYGVPVAELVTLDYPRYILKKPGVGNYERGRF